MEQLLWNGFKDQPERKAEASSGEFKPVLGLGDEAGERLAAPARWGLAAGSVYDQPEPEQLIELTVIVPARNEQDCLGACLQSLVRWLVRVRYY